MGATLYELRDILERKTNALIWKLKEIEEKEYKNKRYPVHKIMRSKQEGMLEKLMDDIEKWMFRDAMDWMQIHLKEIVVLVSAYEADKYPKHTGQLSNIASLWEELTWSCLQSAYYASNYVRFPIIYSGGATGLKR